MILSTENTITELSSFLSKNNILQKNELIKSIEKPGEGNMNVVLRITTNNRSFIAKQSRPFVQKYQDIPAPIDRILVEYEFYKNIKNSKVNCYLPKLIAFLPEYHMLFLEDLGESKDMSFIYNSKSISIKHIKHLVEILEGIHKIKVSNYPANLELRKLNHQHIFILPFINDNGINLDDIQEGLTEISQAIINDPNIKAKVNEFGNLYLSEGEVLLHGDYYPGSWMQQDDSIFVLDPEFSFTGPAEFDVAVMIAHLVMATSQETIFEEVAKLYNGHLNLNLVKTFTGIEIVRRIIGLAQLPLQRTLEEKLRLLILAKSWILNENTYS